MAFGENSGLVSQGIGQGVAQGVQLGTQNYQQGVAQAAQERQQQEQVRQFEVNRLEQTRQYDQSRADQQARDKTSAAQNALNLKVQQFNNLQAPTPPQSMNPEEWDQWNKDYLAWVTSRQQLGADIDALMGVTVGDMKNPDGTPMVMKTFSEVATGTSRADAARLLGEKSAALGQVGELTKSLATLQGQIRDAVAAGGTENNPEYDRLVKQAGEVEGKLAGLYKQATGMDYAGTSLDYGALNKAGSAKANSDLTVKALSQFAENPAVAAVLDAVTKSGAQVGFNTKLSDLGLPGEGTLSDVLKLARGDTTLDSAIASGDMKKAIAILSGMSPEERSASPKAATLQAALADPNNTAVQSALAELKLSPAQLRVVQGQGVSVERSNARSWFERAQAGDQSLLQDQDAYVAEQVAAGKTPEQATRAWEGLMRTLGNSDRKTEQEFVLRDQAITQGTQAIKQGDLSQNKALSDLISSGDLYVLDQAGAAGGIRKLFTDALGEGEGGRRYEQTVGQSQQNYALTESTRRVELDTRVEQLRGAKMQNDFDEAANPTRLSLLTKQEQQADLEMDRLRTDLQLMVPERRMALFARGAELGSAWLNSPQTQALAKEFGVDLNAYRTVASFSDWVKGDQKRQSALNEFKMYAADPGLALSSPNRVRQLATTLGLAPNAVL